jgi:hypothetical protein
MVAGRANDGQRQEKAITIPLDFAKADAAPWTFLHGDSRGAKDA